METSCCCRSFRGYYELGMSHQALSWGQAWKELSWLHGSTCQTVRILPIGACSKRSQIPTRPGKKSRRFVWSYTMSCSTLLRHLETLPLSNRGWRTFSFCPLSIWQWTIHDQVCFSHARLFRVVATLLASWAQNSQGRSVPTHQVCCIGHLCDQCQSWKAAVGWTFCVTNHWPVKGKNHWV